MEIKSEKPDAQKPPESREDKLKSALKANLRRRKAQARARDVTDNKKS